MRLGPLADLQAMVGHLEAQICPAQDGMAHHNSVDVRLTSSSGSGSAHLGPISLYTNSP